MALLLRTVAIVGAAVELAVDASVDDLLVDEFEAGLTPHISRPSSEEPERKKQ